ncbi:DNA-3-methyladenine glycosylase [Bradyrhizobium sp. B124]|uniref:DNA-3-methyladenine glycosylase n=1 Tax=Bradyrhizobium sp. B124 TaxID=3140245 RepID=UPI0031834096
MNEALELDLNQLPQLDNQFFEEENVDIVAQKLIGAILIFDDGEAGPVGGSIVETEAYDDRDPTSHSYSDDHYPPKKGSEAMFLPGGHAYVFAASHGFCLNFVVGPKGVGSAVLIRALKPLRGKKVMRIRRGPYCRDAIENEALLCHSPVTLCEALGVSDYQNGASLFELPFRLYARQCVPQLMSGPRVRVASTIRRLRPKLAGSASAAVNAKRRWIDKAHTKFVKERIEQPILTSLGRTTEETAERT